VLLCCGLAVVLAALLLAVLVGEALLELGELSALPLLVTAAVELGPLPCVELVTIVNAPSLAVCRVYTPSARENSPEEAKLFPSESVAWSSKPSP
jgi:hypothetical protein